MPALRYLDRSFGGNAMRKQSFLVRQSRVLFLAAAISAMEIAVPAVLGDDGASPQTAAPPSPVTIEMVDGGIAQSDNRQTWTRIVGKVTVVDSHTLRFANGLTVDIRYTADVPDPNQLAMVGGAYYPCGKRSADYLKTLIGDREVTFLIDGQLREGKTSHGFAFVGEVNLQAELVRNGWAIAGHSGMEPFEVFARDHERGLWRGAVIVPARWRKGERLAGESDIVAEEAAAALALLATFRCDGRRVASAAIDDETVNDDALARLADLPHLTTLQVSRLPGLTDAGMAHLADLALLERLEITGCRGISGAGLRYVTDLPHLTSLDFNHSSIGDAALAHVKNLTNLTSLGLRATKITDAGLAELAGLAHLETLNLWETATTDRGLATVAKLPRLKTLGLVNTSITATGLASLRDAHRLESLEIRHVPGGDDTVLAKVGGIASLKSLEFHDAKLTDAALAHLVHLKALEFLNLGGSQFTDAGCEHLARLENLKTLNLLRVSLTDAGVAHLAALHRLEELHLTDTKITDAAAQTLSRLANLKMLGLSGTAIGDAGLESLTALAHLRRLDVLHSKVTDEGVKKFNAVRPQVFVYYR
jgi:Leucine-rich repeat (LRR) protein/endonuclease YncB( thermonuclease family)